MDAKKLEILMTAVDLGSFSRASEVVGYTQSGLTHLVVSAGQCQPGKPDPGHPGETDGDYPYCGVCQHCHVLDAGDFVPV